MTRLRSARLPDASRADVCSRDASPPVVVAQVGKPQGIPDSAARSWENYALTDGKTCREPRAPEADAASQSWAHASKADEMGPRLTLQILNSDGAASASYEPVTDTVAQLPS